MPAYAKKTTIEDQFGARRTPDGAILCNRCNCNMADETTNPDGAFTSYTQIKPILTTTFRMMSIASLASLLITPSPNWFS